MTTERKHPKRGDFPFKYQPSGLRGLSWRLASAAEIAVGVVAHVLVAAVLIALLVLAVWLLGRLFT